MCSRIERKVELNSHALGSKIDDAPGLGAKSPLRMFERLKLKLQRLSDAGDFST